MGKKKAVKLGIISKSGVSIISKNGVFHKSSYQRFEFFINMQN